MCSASAACGVYARRRGAWWPRFTAPLRGDFRAAHGRALGGPYARSPRHVAPAFAGCASDTRCALPIARFDEHCQDRRLKTVDRSP